MSYIRMFWVQNTDLHPPNIKEVNMIWLICLKSFNEFSGDLHTHIRPVDLKPDMLMISPSI